MSAAGDFILEQIIHFPGKTAGAGKCTMHEGGK